MAVLPWLFAPPKLVLLPFMPETVLLAFPASWSSEPSVPTPLLAPSRLPVAGPMLLDWCPVSPVLVWALADARPSIKRPDSAITLVTVNTVHSPSARSRRLLASGDIRCKRRRAP